MPRTLTIERRKRSGGVRPTVDRYSTLDEFVDTLAAISFKTTRKALWREAMAEKRVGTMPEKAVFLKFKGIWYVHRQRYFLVHGIDASGLNSN